MKKINDKEDIDNAFLIVICVLIIALVGGICHYACHV